MAFEPLDEILASEVEQPKRLPIRRDLIVEFPARIDARAGKILLHLQRAMSDGTVDLSTLTTEDGEHLERSLYGDAAAVLDAEGIVGKPRSRITGTLIVWHLYGQEIAERAWSGKSVTPPNRATRRRSGGSRSATAGTGTARSRTAGGAASGTRARQAAPTEG